MTSTWKPVELPPSGVAFLTGAGISADGPTNGPVGLDLTRRAIDHAFWVGTTEELRNAYLAVRPQPSRELPRLEAVLEIAVRAHGDAVLEDLLSDLVTAPPNALHEFFAGHLDAGGTHITANFDTLIERLTRSSDILHFHGALDGADPYRTIGATLSRIERGFPEPIRRRLSQAILARGIRELVVVGYSGLDFFDMDPFMTGVAPAMAANGTRLVWVDHDASVPPGRIEAVSQPDDGSAPMLLALRRAGVESVRLRAQTSTVLSSYADAFGLPPVRPQARTSPRWLKPPPLADDRRLDGTRRLYLHLGLHRSLGRLLAAHPSLESSMSPDDLAETAWQIGDHRRALRYWRDAFRGPGLALHARRLEREAACLWDRGSYSRAYAVACRAGALARKSDDPIAVCVCLEMRARILNHMRRTPDLHWFASPRRIAGLLDEASRSLAEPSLPLHAKTRLRDVAELLTFDPEAIGHAGHKGPPQVFFTSEGAEVFNQYESLSALLDYRRGSQRRQRALDGRSIQKEWLDTYLTGTAFLGKTAAEKTAPALPGASSHFTLYQAVKTLASAPATHWHRGRLLGRYLMDRRG